jgi:hypothetical protein
LRRENSLAISLQELVAEVAKRVPRIVTASVGRFAYRDKPSLTPQKTMKIPILLSVAGIVLGFASPTFAQQKDTQIPNCTTYCLSLLKTLRRHGTTTTLQP